MRQSRLDVLVCLSSPVVSGSLAQVVGYMLEAPAPPFPVFVLGYAFNGFGVALQVRHEYSIREFSTLYKINR